MARPRNPNRDKAFDIFKEHDGDIQNRVIAEMLDVPEKTISNWKSRDRWLENLDDEVCSTTKKKRSTTNKKTIKKDIRIETRKRIIDALIEAGTYSPALDLLIELYLDAYEEYQLLKVNDEDTEKLRKELAKLLGQLGLDGKNKDLIKKNGVLLEKGDEEKENEKVPDTNENSKLVEFRQRRMRG
ncbi:phage terminase small subunit-related protein [Bacillus sp. JJ722]